MAIVHQLANGLTVACDPMAEAQSAAIAVHIAAGSRSEPDARGGLAHMVEHMVFKGAGERGARQIAEAIEDVGGSLNAWTGRDQTVFHARVLAEDSVLAVDLIADLVRTPRFAETDLESERGVILSELGECRDIPDDQVHDHLFEAAFGGQTLGRPIIGDETSIAAISRNDLTGWVGGKFTPSRMILVAAGRVDPAALLLLAERRFGDMHGSAADQSPAAHFTGGKIADRRTFDQAHWSFALPGLPAADPGVPALALFTQAVGGGMSSRLFQQLREERGLAYSIDAWHQGFADTGLFAVGCATDKAKAGEALALARAIVARAADDLDESELKRARAQIEAGLRMALESAQGRADHLARSIELFGRAVPIEETLAKYRAVDVAAARAAGAALHAGPIALASVGGGALALAA